MSTWAVEVAFIVRGFAYGAAVGILVLAVASSHHTPDADAGVYTVEIIR